MRVLLIEDDYLVARSLDDELRQRYAGIEIVDVGTESKFDQLFRWIELEPPDLVILDIMLAGAEPRDELEIHRGLRGGLRCFARLQAQPVLASVPVILHTALEWADLERELPNKPAHVLYARKGQTLDHLHTQIRSVLLALGKLPAARETRVIDTIVDAVEAKPGTMGVSIDLKKIWPRKRRPPT